MKNQAAYYQKRASEYEQVYQKPERQNDLEKVKEWLTHKFHDLHILDLGCGTGYWTPLLANNARSILAIDINEAVIQIAKQKIYPHKNVHFEITDMNEVVIREEKLQGIFAGFILSHIRREELSGFFASCGSKLNGLGQVIFIDNLYVKDSSTPIGRTDDKGNTYQIRKLHYGETFEVLKNFYQKKEIEEAMGAEFELVEWIELDYYWMLLARVSGLTRAK